MKCHKQILGLFLLSLYQEVTLCFQTLPPNKLHKRWQEKFHELQEYKDTHGDTLVPQNYELNPALGRWVRRQRLEYSKLVNNSEMYDDVSQYRIHQLKSIGFVFDVRKDVWSERIEELKDYKDIHGHANVPQYQPKNSPWYQLGIWVRNQRTMYHRMKNSGENDNIYNFLTEDRINQLNEIDFCWDVQEETWMEHYQKLVDFKKEFGHANVPPNYKVDPSLARWVLYQRPNKKQLLKKRVALLDSLGFDWKESNKHDEQWWKNYNDLLEFKQSHGNLKVSKSDNPKLYSWIQHTKQKCRKYCEKVDEAGILVKGSVISGLDDERLDALRDIGFYDLPTITRDGRIKYTDEETRKYKQRKAFQAQSYQPDSPLKTNAKDEYSLFPQKAKVVKEEKKPFVPFPWDEI